MSGVTVNVLLLALTDYGLKTIFHSASNSPRVNVIGADATGVHPFVLAAGVAVLCVHVLLRRTVLGVRIRAVGERPEALDTLGLSVVRLRYTAVLLSGLFAGLGAPTSPTNRPPSRRA